MEAHMKTSESETLARETLLNWPNAITVARIIICLPVFAFAAYSRSTVWNFVGLGLHWALDGLDGYLARSLKQETRFGAQIDIIADRAMVAFFYINYLPIHPHLAAPIVLYLILYGFVDHYLSNQFLQWGLLSPNYFYQADPTVWLLNWSTPGKFANSGLFTVLVLSTDSAWATLPALIGLAIVKFFTIARVHRLALPKAWADLQERPPEARLSIGELLAGRSRA
jgi:CDP-diacylglycerol--glycerol-3-phosphate 3-phosphatidyltransferase